MLPVEKGLIRLRLLAPVFSARARVWICVHAGVCPCHRFIESLYCVNVSNGGTLFKNAGSTFLCPLHPITSCSEWQPHEPLKPSHRTRSTVGRPARGWKGILREARTKNDMQSANCGEITTTQSDNLAENFWQKPDWFSFSFFLLNWERFLNARNYFVPITCQFITTLLFPRVEQV